MTIRMKHLALALALLPAVAMAEGPSAAKGGMPYNNVTDARLQNPATSAEQRLNDALVWANDLKALSPYDGLNQNFSGDFIRWRELGITYTAAQSLDAARLDQALQRVMA